MKRISVVMVVIVLSLSLAACAQQKAISFLADPRNADEAAIASAMEDSVASYNSGDFVRHVAHYAPDARIQSLAAGGFVTRDQYESTMKTAGGPNVYLSQVKIIMESSDLGRMEAVLMVRFSRGMMSKPVTYMFARRNGEWLIVEQKF